MKTPFVGSPVAPAETLERGSITVLCGPQQVNGSPTPDTLRRLWRGLDCWQETGEPLVLVGGSAHLMQGELERMHYGPTEADVLLEDRSRDTVSSALRAKRDIFLPHEFTGTRLVTADYHLARATNIFTTVMGPDFTIYPIPARTDGYTRLQRLRLQLDEAKFSAITKMVFLDYDPTSEVSDIKVLVRMRQLAGEGYSESTSTAA